jgi:hypothetical protein
MPYDYAYRRRTTTSTDPAPDSLRRPFTLAGAITFWNHATRELTVLNRALVLIPYLATVGLKTGREVIVAGYHDASTGRSVVTRLHLD